MEGYNGWSNRSTWNVALWLSNEEGLYRATRNKSARYIQVYCEDIWPSGNTPDGDSLREVDWAEVSSGMED